MCALGLDREPPLESGSVRAEDKVQWAALGPRKETEFGAKRQTTLVRPQEELWFPPLCLPPGRAPRSGWPAPVSVTGARRGSLSALFPSPARRRSSGTLRKDQVSATPPWRCPQPLPGLTSLREPWRSPRLEGTGAAGHRAERGSRSRPRSWPNGGRRRSLPPPGRACASRPRPRLYTPPPDVRGGGGERRRKSRRPAELGARAQGDSWNLPAHPQPTHSCLVLVSVHAELVTIVRRFSQTGIQDFLTLTLTERSGLLYVGAREALFAFSVEALELQGVISWEAPAEKKTECIQKGKSNQTECFNFIRFLQPYNASHLYVCGTYAFQPKCAYIDILTFTLGNGEFEDGKGKCPYDPAKGHTGLLVDGELYSATLNNFLGTEPVILRNMGPHHSMKTEYLAFWLNEPHFVGSAYVPESVGSFTGDDDKIYFFFSERAVEYDCYAEQVVARVARVCKGDMGGARTLQKKWTTFLKARLACSAPNWQLYFNQLRAMHTLQGASWHNTTFFGVFRARWGDVDLSAVCEYQLEDIQRVFEGPYKEYHEQAQKWGRYTDPVPSPRPGSCINNWHRHHGYTSSLELPDNTLNFIKKHPLMEEQVGPRWGRPLLVKKDTNFTHLVADRVTGLDGTTYTVLFIGTGDGWLLKAVSLGSWVHLIEELQVFDQEPVESLVLSQSKKLLFAGSRSQLVQLPLADCLKYRSCVDCVLARDPFCAWNVNTSRCVAVGSHSGSLLMQHVTILDTSGICNLHTKKVRLTPKNITVVAGTDLVLPCRLSSNLAHAHWTFGGRDLPVEQPGSFLYDAQLQALVVMAAQPRHAGAYHCFSEEQGARLAAEGYLVAVVAGPSVTLEARAPLENLGLVWLAVVALGALCLVLLLLVLSLRRRLREELEKGAKATERTLVYPLELPKEPTSPPFRPGSETDEKLWDPVGYYYSDGSLKIVPGHARCQPGGGPPSPPPGIPGQPLPSPTRLHLGGGRNSNANGYVRLQLGGEDRGGLGNPLPEIADELRRKLQQRQPLPDSNPEESSV
ncbi:PREDICTED: semaphorin-4C [Dipodomys ordii]|uniref:Semaphorin-4C n=1 Tax=Dipodomys ordii TaxID=10020 RepID=A0A1S3FGY5_DIPOR|nr:PREDICTED: semaphorin-4C [Dipodomys ordii]